MKTIRFYPDNGVTLSPERINLTKPIVIYKIVGFVDVSASTVIPRQWAVGFDQDLGQASQTKEFVDFSGAFYQSSEVIDIPPSNDPIGGVGDQVLYNPIYMLRQVNQYISIGVFNGGGFINFVVGDYIEISYLVTE